MCRPFLGFEFGCECADKRSSITLHKIKCCSFSVVFLPIKIKRNFIDSKFKGASIGLFHHRESHTRCLEVSCFQSLCCTQQDCRFELSTCKRGIDFLI